MISLIASEFKVISLYEPSLQELISDEYSVTVLAPHSSCQPVKSLYESAATEASIVDFITIIEPAPELQPDTFGPHPT